MTATRLWCSMFSPVDPRVTLASALRPRVPTTTSRGQGRPSLVRRTRFQKAPRTTYWANKTAELCDFELQIFGDAIVTSFQQRASRTVEIEHLLAGAGEATSLVLLTATALGLASCPITEPLEVAETRAAVQADVFGEEAYPQMLLRIGWAPVNADPLPSTPRRDLSEVVTRLDGSPLG